MPATKDGKGSKRSHLEQVKKTKGKTPDSLIPKPYPSELFYLWSWFCEIKQVGPITFQELQAWSLLTGNDLTPFEVKTLLMIDNIHTKTLHDRS